MPPLSNFLRHRDDDDALSAKSAATIECRLVRRDEVEPALRLLLSTANGPGGDDQVLDFLGFALDRGIDVNATWIALRGGRIVWTLLPVVSPGKTMLIFTPAALPRGTSVQVIAELLDTLARHHVSDGIQLAQMLIDPGDKQIIRTYADLGFRQLAELLYLTRSVRRREESVEPPPPGVVLETYSARSHAAFAQTISRTYESSLDCPGLNGMRDIDDVIAGHQATGEFDPSLWFVAVDEQQPERTLAVLLLSRSASSASIELVYLGLVPESRGRGLSDWLMRHAFACVARDERSSLSLAVDSKNEPALRLYYRHGMQRVGSRVALLKDLRA